jgi:ribosomal protein L24E
MLCSGKCHRLPNVPIAARMHPQATRWLKAAKIEARSVRRGIDKVL